MILTIGLPTFNRAGLLEAQLAWLARARKGLELRCEVLISDNHSDDHTPEVIARWVAQHGDRNVRVNRNPTDVGAVRNIAYCMEAATTPYVWVVGDDDVIDDGAIKKVIDALDAPSELALMVLNFSSRDVRTGRVLFERCFEGFADDIIILNGRTMFERFLETSRWGGLALTTSLIYRTELARQALRQWPAGRDNLTVQLFVTAFCAQAGRTEFTGGTYLECTAGSHHFLKDKKTLFSFHSAQMAEAFASLTKIGYSPTLCKRKILERVPEVRKKLPHMLRRYPIFTAMTLARYLRALLSVQLRVFALNGTAKSSVLYEAKWQHQRKRGP